MARYNIDEIINNANSQKKKKKRFDIDRILNNADNISKELSTIRTTTAILGSARRATNNTTSDYMDKYREEQEKRMLGTNNSTKDNSYPVQAIMDTNGNIYSAKELNAEKVRSLGNVKSGIAQYVDGKLTNFQENKKTDTVKNMQEEQRNFAKSILKTGVDNLKTDFRIIGSNLKDSAETGILQFGKTLGMMSDNAQNTQIDMQKMIIENTIKERKKRGLETKEYEDMLNSSLYNEVDSKPFYQEKINKINQRMVENTERASNPVTKKIAELSQSMGNNLLGMGATAINPALGFTYFTGSATGGYYDEAIEKGMNDDDARNYASIMGLMEGATEKYLSTQNLKSAKAIVEGTGIKNALKSFGLEIGENFTQEAIMPVISELTTKAVAGNEYLRYDYSTAEGWKKLGLDSLSDGIDGALSAILLNGTTKGISSCINITNKIKNGANITKREVKTALSDAQKSGIDVETIIKEKINEATEKNKELELAQGVQNNSRQQTILKSDDILNNKERVRDILSRNGSFSEQVDKYIANKLPSGDFLYLGETPAVLQNLGLPNNEVILKQSKLKTLMQESNNNTDKLHGLPIETIKKIPEAIANPLNILQSSTDENSVVIITDLADANERPIIASIEVNYDGQIGNIDFLSNRLTSAYGKNNYDRFMKTEIAKGNLLYDIDEGIIKELPATRLQSPKGISSFVDTNNNASTTNNSISQNNNSVKNNTTITNNYAQQTQNDTLQDHNIANNQEILYNNNEREVGINETILEGRDRRDGRVEGKFTNETGQTNNTGIGTENISESFKQNRKKSYEEFIEFANKNIVELDTAETTNIKSKAKELGLNAILFNGDGTKDYYGMTDKNNPNNVYIDINQKEIRGEDILYHEFLHSMKRNNDNIYIDKISPIEQDLVESYSDVINNFIEEKGLDKRYKKYPELIAEEIIADYTSKHLGSLEVDYKLPLFYEETINQAVDEMIKNKGVQTDNKDVAQTKENNVLPTGEYTKQKNKILNPTEIANLNMQDANTTPKLKQKNYAKGNKQSSFLSNIVTDAKFLNEDLRQEMSKEDNIKYYKGITNKGTLESAYKKLQENGQSEAIRWHSKDSKKATAEDVAEGWILLKQYQDNGDYQSAVEVAKKMRDIGTTAGQTVQAYNILSRLTPEGMFYYAQSELDEAYNRMVEGKSKKWIKENQSNFNLTPEETQSILDIMKDVSTMEDGYNKKVKIAEIQKMITDKIPPTAGQSIKAWMRISMLFNPKTQVRNVMGNAVIMPVNMFSDSVSAGIDKLISKKTGVRTIGNTNLKNYGKGFGTGLYQSYNDFKKGINTRNIEGNRFEVSEGKNFKNKGIGKALNRVDNLLSFMLDAGDRGFYEATFTNSINNQMVLNNVTKPTQEMIDIATNEALQRTWQDNNNYTQSVLKIRNILNNVNIKGYGLGDVIIPFAKTPANLTKAIVDYSPAGLVKTLATDARKLKNSLENGQYTAQTQHRFVQNLGKGMAGSFLYVISYALAEAGIATGEADEDKDVKNFIKNSLGINSYSIKIGDTSFAYDWAQPIATPLAIMTNYVKYSKENPDANALEKGINAMNIGTEQLLQQSFMDSLNTVLNGSGTTLENLSQAILELPARAIPTFSKQIADMVDGTQRTTFEYDRPIQSAINSVKAKIPGLSKTLPASIDTLGNEIQKYGGNNNLWNVMFNPANTNKGQLSKAGEEIYNIYKETGDKTIFPRTAPYYINNNNEKVTMTAEQRSSFQTISGKYVENSLNSLLSDKDYKKLSSEEKANIINEIVSDSYSKAKYDVLKIDSKEYEKLRSTLKNVSSASYYSYKFKTREMKKDSKKIEVLVNSNYNNKEKTALYEQYILSSTDKKYPIIKEAGIDINQYLKYKQQEFTSDKEDDGTLEGKTISGSKKEKVWNYIEGMNISYTQKLILYSLEYAPSDSQKIQIINYIESLSGKTKQEKLDILSQFKGFTIYKDGTFSY